MTHSGTRLYMLAAVAALCLPLLALGAQRATAGEKTHVDEKHGFSIKIPSGWEQVPLGQDEKWVRAKYVSRKTYRPKKMGDFDFMLQAHKPRLLVIYLPPKGGPHKDYHHYLEESRPGFHLIKQERTTIHDIPVLKQEMKIEKKTVFRRLIGWTYGRGDERYIVECEILEDRYARLEPMCRRALKSFRFLRGFERPTTASAPGATRVTSARRYDLSEVKDRIEWRKMPFEERTAYRKAREKGPLTLARQNTPSDWTMHETPNYLILSEHKAGRTERFIEKIQICHRWLEENFSDLSDDYVRRRVVRYFASQGSYNAYEAESSDTDNEEIVIHEDYREGTFSLGILSNVVSNYFREKLVGLGGSSHLFPEWLDEGLDAIRYCDADHGRFRPYTQDKAMREARRKKEIVSAQVLMHMTNDEFTRRGWGVQKYFGAQASRLFLFLIERQKKKKGYLQGFLNKYILEAIRLDEEDDVRAWEEAERLRKEEEERKKKGLPEKKSKQEEEEGELDEREVERRYKLRQLARKKAEMERERARIRRLHEAVLKWKKKDWRKLETSYKRAIK